MIHFKDLTLEDKETVTKYTLTSSCKSCDISFSNLMSWKFWYNTTFTIIDDCLVFRFHEHERKKMSYMIPFGAGDIKPIIEKLIENSIEIGEHFHLLASADYLHEKLDAEYLNKFNIKVERNQAEYLYNRIDLETLKGNKLHAKRNHVTRFKKDFPSWEYKELSPELIENCIYMEQEWFFKHEMEDTQDVVDERRSLLFALNHLKETGAIGGVLYVEDHIVAFTIGCQINQNTIGIHFEKADTNYEGAYAMINQLFVQHLPEQYEFINREEDLGVEGLRTAKMSYHPCELLDRCLLTLKDERH